MNTVLGSVFFLTQSICIVCNLSSVALFKHGLGEAFIVSLAKYTDYTKHLYN